VNGIGPVDPETSLLVNGGIKDQTRRALTNLKAQLEASGTSMDKVVWANWALRDASEFDLFNEEWARWFPGDAPLGQLTMLPPLQRRAGFRVSLGVIAEA
jgi:2-iminobutanoate/2-iminopropanoate deaminase